VQCEWTKNKVCNVTQRGSEGKWEVRRTVRGGGRTGGGGLIEVVLSTAAMRRNQRGTRVGNTSALS
jgi:hypothetical protein